MQGAWQKYGQSSDESGLLQYSGSARRLVEYCAAGILQVLRLSTQATLPPNDFLLPVLATLNKAVGGYACSLSKRIGNKDRISFYGVTFLFSLAWGAALQSNVLPAAIHP
jgi:hypothetical protein